MGNISNWNQSLCYKWRLLDQGAAWVQRGWKWCTGATFPTPGGDANGLVELPKYPRLMLLENIEEMFCDYLVAYDMFDEYYLRRKDYCLSNKNDDRDSWKHLLKKDTK